MSAVDAWNEARALQEATVKRQLATVLARVADAEPASYLPGDHHEATALAAGFRAGLLDRLTDSPPDAPEIAGQRCARFVYRLLPAGRELLGAYAEDGDSSPRPEPVLDAEDVTEAMLARRAELAARRGV